jgi:hypothetical protein
VRRASRDEPRQDYHRWNAREEASRSSIFALNGTFNTERRLIRNHCDVWNERIFKNAETMLPQAHPRNANRGNTTTRAEKESPMARTTRQQKHSHLLSSEDVWYSHVDAGPNHLNGDCVECDNRRR